MIAVVTDVAATRLLLSSSSCRAPFSLKPKQPIPQCTHSFTLNNTNIFCPFPSSFFRLPQLNFHNPDTTILRTLSPNLYFCFFPSHPLFFFSFFTISNFVTKYATFHLPLPTRNISKQSK